MQSSKFDLQTLFLSCRIYFSSMFCLLFCTYTAEASDSLNTPKHYFKTTFIYDFYTTGSRPLQKEIQYFNRFGRQSARPLAEYQFRMHQIGFSTPVYTKTWIRDNERRPTFHTLVSGNILFTRASFERSGLVGFGNNDILQINAYKTSIGFRAIYHDGDKNSFFFHISPFFSQEDQTFKKPKLHFWGSFIYNRTINENLSLRFGILKTYTLTNIGFYLPYIGVRIGKIQGFNALIQFPRNISVQMPLYQQIWRIGLFTRPVGGIFNVSNADSVLYDFFDRRPALQAALSNQQIQFRFYELNTGLQVNYRPNNSIEFYALMGFVTRRFVDFALNEQKGLKNSPIDDFRILNGGFLQFGLTWHIGRSKSTANQLPLYDVFDLNSGASSGDAGLDKVGGNQAPMQQKLPKSKLKYNDIKDIIHDLE